MTTAGIIGGIGPESTVVYYRSIVAEYQRRKPDGSAPKILLNSVDNKAMLAFVIAHDPEGLVEFLIAEIDKLAAGGADFAIIGANTPHMVFIPIAMRAPIPLISIVEVTRDAAKARGLSRLGLFGTRYTMGASFYADVFSGAGMTIVAPAPDEQEFVHNTYFNELANGIVRDESRVRLLDIAERMRVRDGIEGLILGGTELSLILSAETKGPVPILDTTALHASAVVDRLLASSDRPMMEPARR